MSKKKPIRVFYSVLSHRFYATQHYREEPLEDGTSRFTVTGVKYDVTDDIWFALTEHGVTPDILNREDSGKESAE